MTDFPVVATDRFSAAQVVRGFASLPSFHGKGSEFCVMARDVCVMGHRPNCINLHRFALVLDTGGYPEGDASLGPGCGVEAFQRALTAVTKCQTGAPTSVYPTNMRKQEPWPIPKRSTLFAFHS